MAPRFRIRHHVNPLAEAYMVPRAKPLLRPAEAGQERLEVELGCAEGQFAFQLARKEPRTLVVGLDIREPIIRRNCERAANEGVTNLVFQYVNLNVDLDRVFGEATVDRFHLLFPDPWFKGRHRKRRVLDAALVRLIRRQLRPGGELHMASDVYEVALDAMAELEDQHAVELGFANVAGPWSFVREAPVQARSRREDKVARRGQRVWRLRYVASGANVAGAGKAIVSESLMHRSKP